MHLFAVIAVKKTLLHAVRRFGGPGLVVLGLVDNSLIPLPGGMDTATILLAASQHEPWWYYALMATTGAMIGGYLTYRLGIKGGEETLLKRMSKRRADQFCRIFGRYGFWSIVVSAITPPPMPIVPVLIAAGALRYPWRKFLAALALGRIVRYALLAYLGHLYGRQIVRWLARYYLPLLYVLIALSVFATAGGFYYWWQYKKESKGSATTRPQLAS
jgi:membrane protein YqaA with SNARE-associated domain